MRSPMRHLGGAIVRLCRSRIGQFLVIGGLLFALSPAPRSDQEIRITTAELKSLQAARARQLGVAALSEDEARETTRRAVEDEVLFREALRLGLAQGDGVVRQRLIQKVLFLAEELGGAGQPPGEAELRTCYARQAERFRRPASIDLVQVFAVNRETLLPLRPPLLTWRPDPTAATLVPPIGESFPLNRNFRGALTELAAQYGSDFAAAVQALPKQTWSEPLPSKFGWHLVRVLAFTPERQENFEEARSELILLCWLQQRESAVARMLERSMGRYRVSIEGQGLISPTPSRRVAARSDASWED
jgi:peptidyl-prolyl cis-trans isomerase C